MLARNFRILAALPVLALLTLGCTNTEGKYNDFVSRQKALQEGGTDSGPDSTPCTPPAPGDIDAQYLLALSPKIVVLQPPVVFLADVTIVAGQAGGSALKMTLHPLSYADRKTEVGSPVDLPAIGIGSDGVLDQTSVPTLTITGAANPLQHDKDIVAHNVRLVGQMCGTQDFYCGTVTGDVTAPVTLKLDGSAYTLELVSDPGKLPPDPIYVDCAKNTAPPIP